MVVRAAVLLDANHNVPALGGHGGDILSDRRQLGALAEVARGLEVEVKRLAGIEQLAQTLERDLITVSRHGGPL